jgi:hypothetical protein
MVSNVEVITGSGLMVMFTHDVSVGHPLLSVAVTQYTPEAVTQSSSVVLNITELPASNHWYPLYPAVA